jgi:hypothetical protein
MSINYGQERICVEKPLPDEEKLISELNSRGKGSDRISKLRAAFYTSKLWPRDATIRIKFINSQNVAPSKWTPLPWLEQSGVPLDPLENEETRSMSHEEAVKKIVNERIVPIVGLNILFVQPNEQAEIVIGFDGAAGAWSLLGTDCLNARGKTMNLGWMDVSTTIHEFCHALGMVHEHQNPHGNMINWDEQTVYEWARMTQGWDEQTTYNNIIARYNVDQVNGSLYDPLSIMLYFFPGNMTTDGVGTHQNVRLSLQDVKYLNNMYPTEKEISADYIEENTAEGGIAEEGNEDDIGSRDDLYKVNDKMLLSLLLAMIAITILIWLWSKVMTRKGNGRQRRR